MVKSLYTPSHKRRRAKNFHALQLENITLRNRCDQLARALSAVEEKLHMAYSWEAYLQDGLMEIVRRGKTLADSAKAAHGTAKVAMTAERERLFQEKQAGPSPSMVIGNPAYACFPDMWPKPAGDDSNG